jgi:hypothetical protein
MHEIVEEEENGLHRMDEKGTVTINGFTTKIN